MDKKPCPCGRKKTFKICCKPYLNGEVVAPTAEALMRSRYSAFVAKASEYLLNTWHPDTRPPGIAPETGVRWTKLEVLEISEGLASDTKGTVEFRSHYKKSGIAHCHHEKGHFVKIEGQWHYLHGESHQCGSEGHDHHHPA
ncbi:MAG: YchJ family metal-binding protein [Myxococcota bacterium]|nr:YchJ family metal-binding protein [Myxococcota bacterium]